VCGQEVGRSMFDVLWVDPNVTELQDSVQHALGSSAEVEWCREFWTAHARLLHRPPDFLVTNLRLEAYNGLHLVLLAATAVTACIVYATHEDLFLAREAQTLGAFYERLERLLYAVPSYLRSRLPLRDRRDVAVLDRRQLFRGGRRCTDRKASVTSPDTAAEQG